MTPTAVIGYDGSADSQRAIDFAARMLRVETALVVHVWHGALAMGTVSPLDAPSPPTREEEAELERIAVRTAEEGAARAREAGLAAEAEVRRGAGAEDIATTLLHVAEQRDADLVVVGRQGMSRIKAIVLGSVSDAVVRAGRRPVVIVPALRE
jgi:nucleotide-binding universal stress UspA family protein